MRIKYKKSFGLPEESLLFFLAIFCLATILVCLVLILGFGVKQEIIQSDKENFIELKDISFLNNFLNQKIETENYKDEKIKKILKDYKIKEVREILKDYKIKEVREILEKERNFYLEKNNLNQNTGYLSIHPYKLNEDLTLTKQFQIERNEFSENPCFFFLTKEEEVFAICLYSLLGGSHLNTYGFD